VSAEAASCCVTSDCTAAATASSITTASVDDEKTAHHHHQQQQQDSVANITDDSSHVISVTESQDQSTDDDTKHSSACHFPDNVVTVSTDKPRAGTRIFYGRRHRVCMEEHYISLGFFLISNALLGDHWLALHQTLPHVRKCVRFEEGCPKFARFSPKTWGPKTIAGGFMTSRLKREYLQK